MSKLEIDWERFFQWMSEILQAVSTLHHADPPCVHRDLKSLNILIDAQYHVKVGDFGLTRALLSKNNPTLSRMRGTYAFLAPESKEKRK